MRLHNLQRDTAGPQRRCAPSLRTFLPKMELWLFGQRGFALPSSLLSDRYSRSARLSAALTKHRDRHTNVDLHNYTDNHRKGLNYCFVQETQRFYLSLSLFFACEWVEQTCRRAGFFLISSPLLILHQFTLGINSVQSQFRSRTHRIINSVRSASRNPE